MRFDNPYDLLKQCNPSALSLFSDDEQDLLRSLLDFESIALIVIGSIVRTIDSITEDILSQDSMDNFVRQTLDYVKEW